MGRNSRSDIVSSSDNRRRSRWITATLILVVLTFIAFSISPLVSSLISANEPSSANPSPETASPTGGGTDAEELAARARGYELVIEREPDNLSAWQGLLETRIQQQDIQGAIAALEAMTDIAPERTRWGLLLGQAKQQTGDLEGATAAYRRVLDVAPGELQAWQGLVNLQLQQNRPDAAIAELQGALEQAETLNTEEQTVIPVTEVKFLLAQVYVMTGRETEAMAIYDEEIASHPEDFRPYLGKALVFERQGNSDAARPLLEQAADLAPEQFKAQIEQLQAQLNLAAAASETDAGAIDEEIAEPDADAVAPEEEEPAESQAE